ncbi:hypothetical protein IMG5_154540 [Ichthyophthirius multifiliis]|uniref:Uncharacterized protein n=1 Tax=Ichthyophthirius multifiliis TaxID=5932 RepID=G0QZ57_ICHMU|nr:hypothetical protein IMG5_154540 [Ichthyophthirius multifiliis]EGR29507.1 hypothetical protein IMG5_154540 [Ichthyophthirius multifiliis]|eukprot:XP_004030743.1 hypothetical protein IMG5_154540 [Ichthyophthirius multifiliis]
MFLFSSSLHYIIFSQFIGLVFKGGFPKCILLFTFTYGELVIILFYLYSSVIGGFLPGINLRALDKVFPSFFQVSSLCSYVFLFQLFSSYFQFYSYFLISTSSYLIFTSSFLIFSCSYLTFPYSYSYLIFSCSYITFSCSYLIFSCSFSCSYLIFSCSYLIFSCSYVTFSCSYLIFSSFYLIYSFSFSYLIYSCSYYQIKCVYQFFLLNSSYIDLSSICLFYISFTFSSFFQDFQIFIYF